MVVTVLLVSRMEGQESLRRFDARPSPEASVHRIRVVWGGGQAKTWQGTLKLSDGQFQNIVPLGMEPDAGAALQVFGNELRVNSIRASDFCGFDVDIVNSTSDTLSLDLSANGDTQSFRQTADLAPLLDVGAGQDRVQLTLDDSGNRVDISRSPGDRLAVEIDRPHLVFAPGETFRFSLRPTRGTGDDGASARLDVDLTTSSSSRVISSGQYKLIRNGVDLELNETIAITMPSQEGVYDVRLVLRGESFANRIHLNRSTLSRSIQVVVIDRGKRDALPVPDDRLATWSEVFNSDDEGNPWLDRIPGLTPFRFASSAPSIENTGVTSNEINGQTWTEFSPGGWQAIPLQIQDTGRPHIVEVEYIDKGPMALGISILQPDGNGQVQPFGVDSGINIPDTRVPGEPMVRKHRIVFWPGHQTPYLLFANRHAGQSASVGKVRVLAGPDRLMNHDQMPGIRSDTISRRQYLAFYEKPLFAENFSAEKRVDPETGQLWHDWNSFLVGADRWTQYLKENGYTGAMLLVAGDGSSLYPSDLIQPTPRFDSGVFAANGSDPVRKDVVEMLLRVFEREGLVLVPVFHFNSPLVNLEKMRSSGTPESRGITIVDLQGETRLGTFADSSNPVSIYNPLHPAVQTEFVRVVREFTDRYSRHPSLGGVGFLYSKDSVQVMPGQTWGVDSVTLQQFAVDAGIEVGEGKQWMIDLLTGEERQTWLRWRQARMGDWLTELTRTIEPLGKSWLLGSDMLQTQDAFSALAPSLRRSSDMLDALARIGFPVEVIADSNHIVFLQPSEIAPEKSLANNRLNIHLDHAEEGRQVFRDFMSIGTLFSHRYSWAEFDQLRHQNIFGKKQTEPLMRLQPLTPSGDWNRQRLAVSVADGDSQFLVEGGWLTSFGQEEHTAGFVETFTQLPDVRFEDVVVDQGELSHDGVIVRQVESNQRNWFYVVNPTPWKLTTTIQFTGRNTAIESLGSGDILFDDQVDQPRTILELEPFSIRAGSTNSQVKVSGYHVNLPAEITSELQSRLNSMLTKVSRAAQTEPVNVLENPGFESPANQGNKRRQFGWYYDSRSSDRISLRREKVFDGESALTMVSTGTPTWIRSNEFDIPHTGRLSIAVMIRTRQAEGQPPLRISIQGSDGRHVYYRYGIVGGGSRQITGDWQDFAVHFDDLPLVDQGKLQIGFDLMGEGQVDLDHVRVFDRWLDGQDSRALTQLLALAGFQLTNRQDINRCRRILEGYWPRFLEEFFPDKSPSAILADESGLNRSPR